jgi:hypothetical protein
MKPKNKENKDKDFVPLASTWHRLTPFQRKFIRFQAILSALPEMSLYALDQHIQRRQAYLYLAHWLHRNHSSQVSASSKVPEPLSKLIGL